jgi:uncharacterized membrane protein
MTRYDFLKFLHVGFAVVWVGGASILQFFALRALAAGTADRLAALVQDIEWIGNRVLTISSAGAFLMGLALVWDAPYWSFSDDWILIGLALFAVTFLTGILFFGPETGRIGKLLAAEGPDSPAVRARVTRIIVATRLDLVVLFLIVFDMVVKPSFSDGWTIVGALAVAAAIGATIVVPRLRSAPAAAG